MNAAAPATYRCLDLDRLELGDYAAVPLRAEDVLPVMHWRNAQLDVLRQKEPLTPARQLAYWERVVVPSFAEERPAQLLFTLLRDDVAIGYGGLVHVAWEDRRAEVSFLVAPERAARPDVYAEDFSAWLWLVREIAFRRLGFRRLFTETFDLRPLHVHVLEYSGFVREGRLRQHVRIGGRPVDSLLHGCLNPVPEAAA